MAKEQTNKKEKNVRLITPEARLSFPSLFTKRKYEGDDAREDDEGKYEATLLLSKKKDLKAFKAQIDKAAIDKWGSVKGIKMPLLDGDNKGGEVSETYAGHYYCHVRSRFKVAVSDMDKNPLTEEECYAGCYVRASVVIIAGEFKDKKTGKVKSRYVKLALRAIQKTKDGEPFSSHGDAADDFDEAGSNDEANYSDDDSLDSGDDLSEFGLD